MSRNITVSAPARLHFGLLSFGHRDLAATLVRQYGGIGVMVAEPRVELEIVTAREFSVSGLATERVREFAHAWMVANIELPACEIRVLSVIPLHVGLGSGTQLAHAVAAGLCRFSERQNELGPLQLAQMNGRGSRSAVGTYGFLRGGLIAEDGKRSGERLGALRCRHRIPDNWRFVLVRPVNEQGLCGGDEAQAFSELPAVPQSVTARLSKIMTDRLIPGCAAGDFAEFSSAVYEYGIEAGNCFGQRQGGPFASPKLQRMVENIRGMGYAGIGQSSWGPTLFVVTADQHGADDLVERLASQASSGRKELQCLVTRGDNRGAVICERADVSDRRDREFVVRNDTAR